MRILFYDFETTGIPNWKEPSESPCQPHILELGAELYDTDTDQVMGSASFLVKPDGWTVPEEVTALTGITQDRAERYGVPEDLAIGTLLHLWRQCDKRVGHNESFDARIARIAIKRSGREDAELLADEWASGDALCTMRASTSICRIQNVSRGGLKWPKLAEAYLHFTGVEMSNAHRAIDDVRGCRVVYTHLQRMQETLEC